MQELKDKIRYEYRVTDRGAAVDIRTGNAKETRAVHEFLRFQISDHQTGDSSKQQSRGN